MGQHNRHTHIAKAVIERAKLTVLVEREVSEVNGVTAANRAEEAPAQRLITV